ncbi:MAG TPA: PilZ domain-containing protein [Pyrinomonadaceae bacterium]
MLVPTSQTSPDETDKDLMTYVEQRKHERVTVDLHVHWGWTYDCPFQDRIISLSEGGYFLRTERGAPRGQPVFIKFWLPEQKTLCGEVRYHLERWGVGVEFKGLSERETALLAALVEHYRQSSRQ